MKICGKYLQVDSPGGGEKITNISSPKTPQSSRFPIIPKLRLRPDLVDCDAIFWIAESIVGM